MEHKEFTPGGSTIDRWMVGIELSPIVCIEDRSGQQERITKDENIDARPQ